MLELVIHTQAVMLMMLSSTNSESKLIEYFSWLQYFKFDFGFIYEIIKLKKFNCTNSTDKLALLNLFCNETLINYLNLFFIIAFLIMYRLLSKHSFLSIKAISNLFSKNNVNFKKKMEPWFFRNTNIISKLSKVVQSLFKIDSEFRTRLWRSPRFLQYLWTHKKEELICFL